MLALIRLIFIKDLLCLYQKLMQLQDVVILGFLDKTEDIKLTYPARLLTAIFSIVLRKFSEIIYTTHV